MRDSLPDALRAQASDTPRSRPSDTPRLPLIGSVVLLGSIGTLAVAQAPHFQAGFAWVFGAVALLRLTRGRDGRRCLPSPILRVVGFTLSAMALAYLLHRLSDHAAVSGPNALWALMEITCLFEALVLLWKQRAFSAFLVILFSSVHATGIAFAVPGETGLVFVSAYVVVLAWTLVVFERAASFEREPEEEGAVARVRAQCAVQLPWGAALRTTAVLLLFGLPLGALLYLAAPRNWELPGNLGARASTDPITHEAGLDVLTSEIPAASDGVRVAETGPGEGGMPLGAVATIKKNLTPWYEVRLEGANRLPPTVILREKIQDHYDVAGVWSNTLTQGSRARIYRDKDDGRSDGWVPLQHADRTGSQITLRITALVGGNRRLCLQPNEVAIKLFQDGRALLNSELRETADEAVTASRRLRKGDVILQRYVAPVPAGLRLVGRRSDSTVAPQISYLQVPPEVRGPLERHARRVVGSETDPWRRALLLERWLKSDAFTYTLKVPALDTRNPIVDFIDRTRSGHCEPFAFALTLMLRTLGHPARYVHGFWGGDRLDEERMSVILRGSHYHAWTEMVLDGVGWVPLNPTPPDRRAADAGSLTAAEALPSAEDPEWSFDFLGFDDTGWRTFWHRVGATVDAWVLVPLAALFSPGTGYAGVFLTLLVLWLLARRREAQRLRHMVAPSGKPLPEGAYGQALLLLARKGVRRPLAWTAREYARFVGKRLPRAAEAFTELTHWHEERRYGQRPADRVQGKRLLAALATALRPDPTA